MVRKWGGQLGLFSAHYGPAGLPIVSWLGIGNVPSGHGFGRFNKIIQKQHLVASLSI
jgi:hypothetical protein